MQGREQGRVADSNQHHQNHDVHRQLLHSLLAAQDCRLDVHETSGKLIEIVFDVIAILYTK